MESGCRDIDTYELIKKSENDLLRDYDGIYLLPIGWIIGS